MEIPQLIEDANRIFAPILIRRAGWVALGFQVVMRGGSAWNIPDGNSADGLWASLKLSGMFIEHERQLYNPTDVVMITKDSPQQVCLYFTNGDHLMVREGAAGLYEKWQAHKLNCDRILAAAAAQQQAMYNQQLVQDASKLTDDFTKRLRRN